MSCNGFARGKKDFVLKTKKPCLRQGFLDSKIMQQQCLHNDDQIGPLPQTLQHHQL